MRSCSEVHCSNQARRSEKDGFFITGCSSMLSGHFTCMGSDLLSVMNSMLWFWAESSCFLPGMLIQHKISLKSLNITLFRTYNTKKKSYICHDFEIFININSLFTYFKIMANVNEQYLLIFTRYLLFIAHFLGYGLYGK